MKMNKVWAILLIAIFFSLAAAGCLILLFSGKQDNSMSDLESTASPTSSSDAYINDDAEISEQTAQKIDSNQSDITSDVADSQQPPPNIGKSFKTKKYYPIKNYDGDIVVVHLTGLQNDTLAESVYIINAIKRTGGNYYFGGMDGIELAVGEEEDSWYRILQRDVPYEISIDGYKATFKIPLDSGKTYNVYPKWECKGPRLGNF